MLDFQRMDIPVRGQGSSSDDPQQPDKYMGRRIFCNRPLNTRKISAVGFDLDYTLAQYTPETFEHLVYYHTVRKLVNDLNYPREILTWKFKPWYMVRGLVIDKKRGNILKMDRHKYVKIAYHGFTEMSKEDRAGTYGNTLVRDSFDGPDYALIDTLFSLAEAYLFAQLIEFKDRFDGKIPTSKDYAAVYKDIKQAIDLCHRDGTLKQKVAEDPKRYIKEDTSIIPMLKMLKDSGRNTFLVTNSLWDYTSVVMNCLCGSNSSTNFDWLQYFDVVITGSAKPSFFDEENGANLFEVELESGMLLNTNNGAALPPVGNISARLQTEEINRARKVFQGGSVSDLHKLLSIESSSQVLYVGDHIYGDILRSKKVLGWRTMLIIPELEKEIKLLWELRDSRKELRIWRGQRDRIEDEIHHLNQYIKLMNPTEAYKAKLITEIERLKNKIEAVQLNHQEGQKLLHQRFHKTWGQLMKTGYQKSLFAQQVERFACLYTSEVTNMFLYSPDKHYRPTEDFMHHEFGILANKPLRRGNSGV